MTALVEDALLADLPEAIDHIMTRLEQVAALSNDIPHAMEALPSLAGVLRYGNVRQTDTAMVQQVVDGLGDSHRDWFAKRLFGAQRRSGGRDVWPFGAGAQRVADASGRRSCCQTGTACWANWWISRSFMD